MAAVSLSGDGCDFGFGFNDVNFSDRIMKIQILPDPFGFKPDPDNSAGDLAPNRKRRRTDTSCPEETEEREEYILDSNRPDLEDGDSDGNLGAVMKESIVHNVTATGDEVVRDKEPMEHSGRVRVRNLYISSIILAAKSPFFHKLFSNGMKESHQRQFTLQIQGSEEDALLDLLNFMYSNTLPRITPEALLDVLMVADKFEVASCMKYCVQLLYTVPMSVKSALVYLDLPSSVSMPDTVQQLTKVAKQFLSDHFKDLSKCKEEVLELPLAGIEIVLSNDDLQVISEDDVYDIVVKWTQSHYPELEERRDMLRKLIQLVRFPFMSYSKLKQFLVSGDIDPELASKSVMDALFFKAKSIYKHDTCQLAEDVYASNSQYAERSYTSRPVKVVEFESPWKQCVVYWDLKREECAQLLVKRETRSWKFHLGGRVLYLAAICRNLNGANSTFCFRLSLDRPKENEWFRVDCQLSTRMLPSKEFVNKHEAKMIFPSSCNLFTMLWSTFMANDSPYFINGIVHLKLELTLKN